MAFTFRLYLENGEDIGTFATAAPDWRVGNTFHKDGHTFEILNIVVDEDLESDQFAGLFVVTPLELAG